MNYKNSKGGQISNRSDWEALFLQSPNKQKQWQPSRSAYELANFMMELDGETNRHLYPLMLSLKEECGNRYL